MGQKKDKPEKAQHELEAKKNACEDYRLELQRQAGQLPRRLVAYEGQGTAGIGDRIKLILSLAAVAPVVHAALSLPLPCAMLEKHHMCRVQLQMGMGAAGCNTTCEWRWSRYVDLDPPALLSTPADLKSLERQLRSAARLGPTLVQKEGGCASCAADLARAQASAQTLAEAERSPLLWRLSPGAAAAMVPSLPKPACVPAIRPSAAVRALHDRYVRRHGLRPSHTAEAEQPAQDFSFVPGDPYHAFHIRREGCVASMTDVARVALQLRNTTAATTSAAAAGRAPVVRTLLLFTDEPGSAFFAEAHALLARHFRILRLDDEIMSWQREADGGSTDNYMVYLAELLLGRGAVANGHVYRCKGPDCPACRVDVNAHPGGARGWSFGE